MYEKKTLFALNRSFILIIKLNFTRHETEIFYFISKHRLFYASIDKKSPITIMKHSHKIERTTLITGPLGSVFDISLNSKI